MESRLAIAVKQEALAPKQQKVKKRKAADLMSSDDDDDENDHGDAGNGSRQGLRTGPAAAYVSSDAGDSACKNTKSMYVSGGSVVISDDDAMVDAEEDDEQNDSCEVEENSGVEEEDEDEDQEETGFKKVEATCEVETAGPDAARRRLMGTSKKKRAGVEIAKRQAKQSSSEGGGESEGSDATPGAASLFSSSSVSARANQQAPMVIEGDAFQRARAPLHPALVGGGSGGQGEHFVLRAAEKSAVRAGRHRQAAGRARSRREPPPASSPSTRALLRMPRRRGCSR